MQTRTFQHKADDIEWYCESRGSGPTVVLIPSGEGDCGNFATVADALADEFTFLTFDMPGFSRSSAPPNFDQVTARMLGDQISTLVKSMALAPATFYGCSSGGQAVLSLVADHPDMVRNGIVHEAALAKDVAWPDLAEAGCAQMNRLDDAGIVAACKDRFRNRMNFDPQACDALGADYHRRLEKNYITWVRHYYKPGGVADRSYGAEELKRRPIAWSIGGFSEVWFAISNLRVAQRANIEVEIFKCKHFPQVEIPDVLGKPYSGAHKTALASRTRGPSYPSYLVGSVKTTYALGGGLLGVSRLPPRFRPSPAATQNAIYSRPPTS
jgi:pimeloyl-ACP methyl ester carboxylesterase